MSGDDLRCDQMVEMLVELFAEELSEEAREMLWEHCAVCPDCDNFLHTYSLTLRLTEHLLQRSLTPEDRAAIEAKIFPAGADSEP